MRQSTSFYTTQICTPSDDGYTFIKCQLKPIRGRMTVIKVVPSVVVEYIDKRDPRAKKQQEQGGAHWFLDYNSAPFIKNVISLVDNIPEYLITLNGGALMEFFEAIEALQIMSNRWNNGDKTGLIQHIPGYGNTNPLTLLRKHLVTLHDEGAEPTTNELLFIADEEFRESLRRDLGSIDRSIASGEWKAGTILGGSVIEALLLYRMQKYDERSHSELEAAIETLLSTDTLRQQPPPDLNKWGLHELTEVAYSVSLIKDETASQCRIAKNFRNLIHPGKAERLALECDRGTAYSVLAAVEHVMRDLTL